MRITWKYIFILFFFQAINSLGQEFGVLKGRVLDENKLPIIGANVTIQELITGTVSDEDGNFELKIPANKAFTVEISFLGYKNITIPVNINNGKEYFIERQLEPTAEKLGEVYIESKYDRAGTLERIDTRSIDMLPTATGGIESMLSTLGGASIRSEFSSQYSVRGGNFDENLVYINDVEIYRPLLVRAGQQEGLSIINPDLVSSVQFSAGGFGAQYGDKMSSVLDIKYKRPNRFGGSFSGSFLGATAHVEGASKNKKFTNITGIRYKTNQYLLSNLQTKGDYKPSFLDIQTYFTYDITKTFEISCLGIVSQNKYKVVPQSRETTFGTYQQTLSFKVYYDGQEIDKFTTFFGSASLDYHPSEKLLFKFTASAFNIREEVTYDIQGQYLINYLDNVMGSETFGDSLFNLGVGTYLNHARNYLDARVYSISHKGSFYSNNGNLKWGVKYQVEEIDDQVREWEMLDSVGYSIPYSSNEVLLYHTTKSKNNLYSERFTGFFQHTYNFSSKNAGYFLTTGIRAHYWSYNNQLVVSPRAVVTIKPYWVSDFTFHAAAGYYFQPAFYKELRDPDGAIYKNIKAQKSVHYVLGTRYNFSLWDRPFVFTSEMYYKHLWNLIPYKVDDVEIQYLPQYIARGYATGIEFKINGEFVKDAESWASLSILQTREDIYKDYYLLPDKTVVTPGFYRRPTDQWLNFGMFFQDYFPNNPDYKVHLNLLYASRLPYGTPDYDRPDQNVMLKPYRRVDIGLSKSLKNFSLFKDLANIWISFEIFNLFGIENEASYQWVKTIKNQYNINNTYAVPNYLTGRVYNLKLTAKF